MPNQNGTENLAIILNLKEKAKLEMSKATSI